MHRRFSKKSIVFMSIFVIVSFVMVAALILLVKDTKKISMLLDGNKDGSKDKNKHYALILQNPGSNSAVDIFEGCKKIGEANGVTVDLYGEGLSNDYSVDTLLKMAKAAKVDGIIVEAKEQSGFAELINAATDIGIPVVTVLSDCMDCGRISYVGNGGYELGREYARQIIRKAKKTDKTVCVLMDAATDDSTQNIICNGIRDTLRKEGNHLELEIEVKAVDNENNFTVERSIRDLFTSMTELPDFIVCLSELNTLTVYQTVIDYNLVGKVDILGFYTNDIILQAINKGGIVATISTDYKTMGEKCVEALIEYESTGYTNGYYLNDIFAINYSNVGRYLNND